MNHPDAQRSLRRMIPARLPILLTGAPGVGKTAIVKAGAQELGLKLVVSHPVTSDPTDYRGLPWMVDGRAKFLPVGDLSRLTELEDAQVAIQAARLATPVETRRALTKGLRPPHPR